MADKGGIQLLSETRKKIEVNVPGEKRFLTIGMVVIVVVLVAFGALKAVTNSLEKKVREKNAAIVALNQSRNKPVEQQLVALSKQSGLIGTFLENHVFWSKALAKIQQALQQQVKFTVLNAAVDKHEITFTALAPDYTVIARQLASFVADDGVKDVQITNAKATNNGSYEFGVKILFDESKYIRQ